MQKIIIRMIGIFLCSCIMWSYAAKNIHFTVDNQTQSPGKLLYIEEPHPFNHDFFIALGNAEEPILAHEQGGAEAVNREGRLYGWLRVCQAGVPCNQTYCWYVYSGSELSGYTVKLHKQSNLLCGDALLEQTSTNALYYKVAIFN